MTTEQTEVQRRLLALEENKALSGISLREYLERRLHDHQALHNAERVALDLASQNVDHRLQQMNEFRNQMGDQVATFQTREVADERLSGLQARLSYLELASAKGDGARLVITSLVALAASGAVSLLVGLLLRA